MRRRRAIQNDACGDDGEVEAGDNQHVKGAGALKADAERMREVSAVSRDHGGEHHGVVRRETKRSREPAHGGGKSEQARGCGVLPDAETAGERRFGRAALTFYLVDVDGCGGGDALIDKKFFAAPDAGVAIGLRLEEADLGAKTISALEGLRRRTCNGCDWPVDGEADGACGGGLLICGVGD